MSEPRTIAFLGASGGCGLAALKQALASENTLCVALCREPSKLTSVLPETAHPNLIVKEGNAHSATDVADLLTNPKNPSRLVDVVCSSIGNPMQTSKAGPADPNVCDKGTSTLLEALASLRKQGLTGAPRITVVSSTGISSMQRDIPLAVWPMYKTLLRGPHADKKAMEERLIASEEKGWTIVRPSLLTNGHATEGRVRVGVEDPKSGKLESKAVGYTISREDVGRWMWEDVLKNGGYADKVVTITY